uniref:Insulin-like peptide transcript variant X4 n=1 Tax=Galleria mellonella TaxID=7137 RepID=A0AA50F506_GALME|nr:insulin-like peptide transcript variant X4 [Galleria mellonella]
MKGFYVFMVLVTCYSIASAHILTSAYVNYPSAICKKMLNHALDSVCTYNYESTELLHETFSKEVDTTSWEYVEKVLDVCCLRPCTLSELLSACPIH